MEHMLELFLRRKMTEQELVLTKNKLARSGHTQGELERERERERERGRERERESEREREGSFWA